MCACAYVAVCIHDLVNVGDSARARTHVRTYAPTDNNDSTSKEIRAYARNTASLQKITGLMHHVHNEQGKAPMLVIVYPGERPMNVMFYGHLDKQPHMAAGWSEGLGPCKPVIKVGGCAFQSYTGRGVHVHAGCACIH